MLIVAPRPSSPDEGDDHREHHDHTREQDEAGQSGTTASKSQSLSGPASPRARLPNSQIRSGLPSTYSTASLHDKLAARAARSR